MLRFMNNFRLILQKKEPFQVQNNHIQNDILQLLQLQDVELKNMYLIYDVFNSSRQQFEALKNQILLDVVTDEEVEDIQFSEEVYFAIEPLPGQFDPTANSAIQCLQLIDPTAENVSITTAKALVFNQKTTEKQLMKMKSYFINPVDSREKDLSKPLSLPTVQRPERVRLMDDFISLDQQAIETLKTKEGLAMSVEDLLFIQSYFKNEEQRNPSETEIKVLDTYWSDHCRHTTFLTELQSVSFEEGEIAEAVKDAYKSYQQARKNVYGNRLNEKPECLMDLAILAAKDLKQRGILTSVEESEEINACSVYTKVKTENGEEDWLLMFKNETHNHPTEIEPFGGASTCLGGCIRDPLSGRAYVYQAMRVSGAANVLEPVSATIEGKLPQQKITQEAAEGFASYGNQIGLATTQVAEIYHPGYQAKRMEVGAVVAAAPADWVRRESPKPGDVILLLGGKTGRDGVGGATGSSKEHTEESLETAGAEVQKGNPPEERKIQRFFRNKEVTTLIKKCNDFGAGGVSVAIGELADGLEINLDLVPTKYKGLNGTELALSESQERMAVVIAKEDKNKFQKLAAKENLEATHVANVTDTNRLQIKWKNELIVDISRDFLDTNGVRQTASVLVEQPKENNPFKKQETATDATELLLKKLSELNSASQQGLAEQFDSSIGSSTVQMPFGGKYQFTPAEGSIQTFPVLQGNTSTASAMTWGFNPDISSWSPFHGGAYAVIESMAKIVSLGANPKKVYYTFQEYFRKLGDDPANWGLPFAALLGAFEAQQNFQSAAIGGKDSMSGTFNHIHVPPTLISFAVAALDATQSISNELKQGGHPLYLLKHKAKQNHLPDYNLLNQNFELLYELNQKGKIASAASVKHGGIAVTLSQMAFGNKIGYSLTTDEQLFSLQPGSIIIEAKENIEHQSLQLIGKTTTDQNFEINGNTVDLETALTHWQNTLEVIFPTVTDAKNKSLSWRPYQKASHFTKSSFSGQPRVFIPAFPGTNCEYDSEKAFLQAGAATHISVFRNLRSEDIQDSINDFSEQVNKSQILMLSGGFSAGDEPDGSGKFITAVLRNEQVQDAIQELLNRDGLILGICNGFQALVKSGLLPYGKFQPKSATDPTLAENEIGRHISQIVTTKVVSTKSPWLNGFKVGQEHQIAISHGEGRFYISDQFANQLFLNGQVATQYVNLQGEPSLERPFNPNGSSFAIEGITSADGKIFGKMGHSERKGQHLYRNIPGEVGQDIFKNGVEYFL